jgi:hypothetical protein
MRTLWTSILLIIIGILIILTLLRLNHIVTGEMYIVTILLTGGYFTLFILTTILSYNKAKRQKTKFNFIPIIITIAFSIIIPFFIIKSLGIFKAPIIFEAYRPVKGHQKGAAYCELQLLKDNTYEAILGYVEASGVYEGDYIINNDTIILKNDIVHETDSIFCDKYLIDRKSSTLFPIRRQTILQDTTLYLEITKK